MIVTIISNLDARVPWRLRDSCQTRCCRISPRRGNDNTRSMQPRNEMTGLPRIRGTSRTTRASSPTRSELTWKTFLKKGLLAESITLCAVRHCPSLARVTSTRPSSSHRLSKLVAILLRKLFHFRHIWLDISRLTSDGTLDGVSRTLSHRGVRGSSHAMTGMANATVGRQSCQARTNIVRTPRPSSMTVHAIGSRLRGKFERRGASKPRFDKDVLFTSCKQQQ